MALYCKEHDDCAKNLRSCFLPSSDAYSAEFASQEAAAEQAAIAEALGKEEAAKVAAAEAGPAAKPVGFFDKLMKLVIFFVFFFILHSRTAEILRTSRL